MNLLYQTQHLFESHISVSVIQIQTVLARFVHPLRTTIRRTHATKPWVLSRDVNVLCGTGWNVRVTTDPNKRREDVIHFTRGQVTCPSEVY